MKQTAKERVYAFLCSHQHMYTVAGIAINTRLARSTVAHALTALRNEGKVERELGPVGFGNLWYV